MKLISQERGYHMKIYFVRHGETLWNKEKKIQGQSDIPLNEYGIELAKITADAMKNISFDVVYTSPLLRAKETAMILIKDRNLDIFEDEQRNNLQYHFRKFEYIRYSSLLHCRSICTNRQDRYA